MKGRRVSTAEGLCGGPEEWPPGGSGTAKDLSWPESTAMK